MPDHGSLPSSTSDSKPVFKMGNSGTQIAFGTNFVGVFALLLDLHNSFSELAAKRCKTNDTSSMRNSILMKLLICLYQISLKYLQRVSTCSGRCGRPSVGAFGALFWISVLIIISANYDLIAMLTERFLARTSTLKSSWTCKCLWRFVSLRGRWKAVVWAAVLVTRSAAVMFKKPQISLWSQWHSRALRSSAVNCGCQRLKWVWLANDLTYPLVWLGK